MVHHGMFTTPLTPRCRRCGDELRWVKSLLRLPILKVKGAWWCYHCQKANPEPKP